MGFGLGFWFNMCSQCAFAEGAPYIRTQPIQCRNLLGTAALPTPRRSSLLPGGPEGHAVVSDSSMLSADLLGDFVSCSPPSSSLLALDPSQHSGVLMQRRECEGSVGSGVQASPLDALWEALPHQTSASSGGGGGAPSLKQHVSASSGGGVATDLSPRPSAASSSGGGIGAAGLRRKSLSEASWSGPAPGWQAACAMNHAMDAAAAAPAPAPAASLSAAFPASCNELVQVPEVWPTGSSCTDGGSRSTAGGVSAQLALPLQEPLSMTASEAAAWGQPWPEPAGPSLGKASVELVAVTKETGVGVAAAPPVLAAAAAGAVREPTQPPPASGTFSEEEEGEEEEWEEVPSQGSGITTAHGPSGASGQVQMLLRRILSGELPLWGLVRRLPLALSHPLLLQLLAACTGSQAGSSSSKLAPGVTGRPLSDAEQAARARLLQAMLDTPWSAEAGGDGGIPMEYSEDSRYAILNDMTAGERQGLGFRVGQGGQQLDNRRGGVSQEAH